MNIKNLIRHLLIALKLDLTVGLKYDRLTQMIINRCVTSDTTCVDIGCHRGEMMDMFLKKSPNKKHYGFEPIPFLYDIIKAKFADKCNIFNYALSDSNGISTFNFVRNDPAYSGLKQRDYKVENPDIELIDVELKTLDSLIPNTEKIGFIKIDVEGAEFPVLKGAQSIVDRDKPFVLFEFGLGGSNHYGTKPEDMFNYFADKGMSISLLSDWLDGNKPLSLESFKQYFTNNKEYYFFAHKTV